MLKLISMSSSVVKSVSSTLFGLVGFTAYMYPPNTYRAVPKIHLKVYTMGRVIVGMNKNCLRVDMNVNFLRVDINVNCLRVDMNGNCLSLFVASCDMPL